MINDRFVQGSIAGIIGAMVQNIYAYSVKLLGITDTLYLDVARDVLFNQKYHGPLVLIVSLLGQMVIDSFLGIVFAYLIKYTSSNFYLYKGIVFSWGIWFLVRVIFTKIIVLPIFANSHPPVELFFFCGAAIFGLTIATSLKMLSRKE
jgi:hypothetical protein